MVPTWNGSVCGVGGRLLCVVLIFAFLYGTKISPFVQLSDLKHRLQRLPLSYKKDKCMHGPKPTVTNRASQQFRHRIQKSL